MVNKDEYMIRTTIREGRKVSREWTSPMIPSNFTNVVAPWPPGAATAFDPMLMQSARPNCEDSFRQLRRTHLHTWWAGASSLIGWVDSSPSGAAPHACCGLIRIFKYRNEPRSRRLYNYSTPCVSSSTPTWQRYIAGLWDVRKSAPNINDLTPWKLESLAVESTCISHAYRAIEPM